jgi:acetyl-CoA carboxylase carboxyltransferase component
MGAEQAINVLHKRELSEHDDPELRRAELIEDYNERHANPYEAAERGYVDDVIDPAETRKVLIRSLELLRTKREDLPRRKHANVPL